MLQNGLTQRVSMESLYVSRNLQKRTEVSVIYAVDRCYLPFSETIFVFRCMFSIVQLLVIYLHVAFLLHLKKTQPTKKEKTQNKNPSPKLSL